MPDPVDSAACCLVHQLGKCDAVFTCCDRCPTFFADRASPVTVRVRRRAGNDGHATPHCPQQNWPYNPLPGNEG